MHLLKEGKLDYIYALCSSFLVRTASAKQMHIFSALGLSLLMLLVMVVFVKASIN